MAFEEKNQNFIFPSSAAFMFVFAIKRLTLKTRIMKKTVLISTAFFLTTASFAQTTAGNSTNVTGQSNIEHNKTGTRANSSANASSATTIHTAVVDNGKSGATQQIKDDNNTIASEKQALAAQAKDKGHATTAAAKTKVASTLEDNNAGESASLSGDQTVSASTGKNVHGKLTSEENQSVHARLKGDNRSQVAVDKTTDKSQADVEANTENQSVHATLKGDKRSQVAVNKTAAHVAASTVHAVHVKPVKVNAAGNVRAAAAIRIR